MHLLMPLQFPPNEVRSKLSSFSWTDGDLILGDFLGVSGEGQGDQKGRFKSCPMSVLMLPKNDKGNFRQKNIKYWPLVENS